MAERSPHSLRALARGLDLLPYVAVLAVPFAWALWTLGTPGNATTAEIEASWWFRGYVAVLLYAPSMALAFLAERLARRWGWARARVGIRLLRWAHCLLVFGPILLFAAVLRCPALEALWR